MMKAPVNREQWAAGYGVEGLFVMKQEASFEFEEVSEETLHP
jgi:hypothetical protein